MTASLRIIAANSPEAVATADYRTWLESRGYQRITFEPTRKRPGDLEHVPNGLKEVRR